MTFEQLKQLAISEGAQYAWLRQGLNDFDMANILFSAKKWEGACSKKQAISAVDTFNKSVIILGQLYVLIQQVRAKKKDSIITYLKEAFKDFDCPAYLFGSYATETFYGDSDVDILVISPQASVIKNYCEACNKMSDLSLDYDILMANSYTHLDRSIVNSLQKINFLP